MTQTSREYTSQTKESRQLCKAANLSTNHAKPFSLLLPYLSQPAINLQSPIFGHRFAAVRLPSGPTFERAARQFDSCPQHACEGHPCISRRSSRGRGEHPKRRYLLTDKRSTYLNYTITQLITVMLMF